MVVAHHRKGQTTRAKRRIARSSPSRWQIGIDSLEPRGVRPAAVLLIGSIGCSLSPGVGRVTIAVGGRPRDLVARSIVGANDVPP